MRITAIASGTVPTKSTMTTRKKDTRPTPMTSMRMTRRRISSVVALHADAAAGPRGRPMRIATRRR
jgi:hypothetical protein